MAGFCFLPLPLRGHLTLRKTSCLEDLSIYRRGQVPCSPSAPALKEIVPADSSQVLWPAQQGATGGGIVVAMVTLKLNFQLPRGLTRSLLFQPPCSWECTPPPVLQGTLEAYPHNLLALSSAVTEPPLLQQWLKSLTSLSYCDIKVPRKAGYSWWGRSALCGLHSQSHLVVQDGCSRHHITLQAIG